MSDQTKNGPGAAATASEATNPHHTNGKKFTMNTTPGGMTLSEAITESVMISTFIKLGLELGTSERFPEHITFDELERFAKWAGTTVEEILQNARDAVGAANIAWVPCTECRWRADKDETPPTHVIVTGDDVSIVHDTLDEMVFLFDLPDNMDGPSIDLLRDFGYRTTGPWTDLTMPNGDSAKIAPIQEVDQ